MRSPALAELALADAQTALAYADCAARHAGAVNAYQAAREAAIDWNRKPGNAIR
ncbi:MAG: hypothetical protein J7498_09195 [Sphingobium sp.]|nr:hypothetical protein [Sphingobium sp.]